MSLIRKNDGEVKSKDRAQRTGPIPESGAPRAPESYLAGEELLDYYRENVYQMMALVEQTQQTMENEHAQMLAQVHAQYQQVVEQAFGKQSERSGLHQQWLNASSELLVKLVEVADAAELVACLEGAPLALAARFLAIEPGLAQVIPCSPAPLDELTLLWRGLAG